MSQSVNRASPEQAPPHTAESGDASMVVHTRARDLLEWLVPHVAKWPREQRHTVTRHVSDLAMQVLDALVAARHLPPAQRASSLREADIRLDQLRQYLQMAWQWGWMAGNQYEHVSRLTVELGRLIGGWRRAVALDAAEGGPRRGSESPRRGPV